MSVIRFIVIAGASSPGPFIEDHFKAKGLTLKDDSEPLMVKLAPSKGAAA